MAKSGGSLIHSKTGPLGIPALQRKRRALELRIMGLTYEQGLEVMRQEMGDLIPQSYNTRNMCEDVKEELRKVEAVTQERAKELITMELMRLDQMMMVMMQQALGGNVKAVDRVLHIMHRRSKLLGLDSPTSVKINDWRSEIIELLKQGKITLRQVEEEFGADIIRELAESGLVTPVESRALGAGEQEGVFEEVASETPA